MSETTQDREPLRRGNGGVGILYRLSDIWDAFEAGAREAREVGGSPSDELIQKAADAYCKLVETSQGGRNLSPPTPAAGEDVREWAAREVARHRENLDDPDWSDYDLIDRILALLRAPRGEARRLEAIGREACDRPKGYASPGYDWNGVIGAGAVFTPKPTAIGQKAPESTDEEITGLFRQLIKDVANAAVLHAGWPNGADEPDRAVIDRRGEIAEYVAGYALEIEPPESLRKLLALLRAPRGEGEAWRDFLAALDDLETAANLWVEPDGPTAADVERLRQTRQRVIACARALAALRSEAPGEDCPETDVIVDIHPANWQDGRVVSDAAVRITHVPTGITVICDDQPTLARNKAVAIAGLRAAVRAARRGEGGGE